jgi:hypothetical protein
VWLDADLDAGDQVPVDGADGVHLAAGKLGRTSLLYPQVLKAS